MIVLVVTHDNFLLRSADGRSFDRIARTAEQTILSRLHEDRPDGLLFCGFQADSLDLAAAIRSNPAYRTLPIALLGNEGIDLGLSGEGHEESIEQRVRSLWAPTPDPRGTSRRIWIDQRARQVSIMKKRQVCSPLEFRLLLFFLRHPDIIFSRDELVARIRDAELEDTRMIDVLVVRIRRKIELSAQIPVHLQTIYGLGYTFRVGEDQFLDAETLQAF